MKPVKLVVTLFLVSLTLSLFLTSVYALPSRLGGGGGGGSKAGSFGLQNSPSGPEGPDTNLGGTFSGIERSASPPPNSGPTGGLANLHPSTNDGTPAALSGLQQQQQPQQQHQPLANPNHVDGCPAVVHPNGADTKVVQPSNCSPPTPDNTPQTNTRVVHTNNNNDNCAAVVHPNGADTKVVSTNGCPTNTNTHVTVNPGGTTSSSSSSSLTLNNAQRSNGGSSSSSTNANTIPIANAGPNQKVHPSDRVVLDGSKSSDPSGGSLKFSWLQIAGGPVVSLSNHDKTKTTFVAPSVTGNMILTFQLIVKNGNYYSAPSYVTIIVQP